MSIESAEKKIAAFFDFDGLYFLPDKNWQIKNPRLGIIGSAVTWEEACSKLNEIRRKDSELQIQECYYFPRNRWDTVELKNSSNVTPPEYLFELVRRHENLNHDLYIISQADCPELIDFIDFPNSKYKKAIAGINPFKNIPFAFRPPKKIKEMSIELHTKEKTYNILNFLRCVNGEQRSESLKQARPKNIYDQIFLYYTQIEYKKALTKALKKNQENFASKNMSLIISYIAKVK